MEISKADEFVKSLQEKEDPEAFLFHLGGNDIKTMSPDDCAKKMGQLLKNTRSKFKKSKIIVSLGLPRLDSRERCDNI